MKAYYVIKPRLKKVGGNRWQCSTETSAWTVAKQVQPIAVIEKTPREAYDAWWAVMRGSFWRTVLNN